MPAPLAALELLCGDAQTFLDKVWASRIHIHHGDADPLVRLLTFDDVDELMTSTAIRTPAVRIARSGSVLPTSAFTRQATLAGQPMTGLVDPRKVFDLFDDGATVVLQGLHRYWEPLGSLVADLELALGHPCQANAYLTPPGSQGFAVHEDSHDVFVFQTHGRKVWEVQEGDHKHTIVLEPGVSMYLPTGTPHAARAEETASLHVTIGINQLTWRTLFEHALSEALGPAGTQHLPAGYLDDASRLADGLADRVDDLVDALRTLDPATVAAAERQRFLTGRTLWHRGGLRDRLAARELTDDTRLARRRGHPLEMSEEGDQVRLLLGDRDLLVPAHLAPALAVVRDAEDLTPGDLAPHLDDRSRLVLCRRLVREGLLAVSEP